MSIHVRRVYEDGAGTGVAGGGARFLVAELEAYPDAWEPLLDAAGHGDVTLLFGARDEEHSNAVALEQYLERKLGRSGRRPRGAPPRRAAAAAARKQASTRRAKSAVSARAPSSRAAR